MMNFVLFMACFLSLQLAVVTIMVLNRLDKVLDEIKRLKPEP